MIVEDSQNIKPPVSERKINNRKMMHQMRLNEGTIQKQLVKRRQVMKLDLDGIGATKIGVEAGGSTTRKIVQAIRPSSKKMKTFGLSYFSPNGINMAESARLSQCIKRCRSMQRFDISLYGNVEFSDTSLLLFSQALKRDPSLKWISFSNMRAKKVSGLGVSKFVQNLRKISLQGLQMCLTFNSHNLGPVLQTLGKSLKRAAALKAIDLRCQAERPCNDDEVLSLFEAIGGVTSLEKMRLGFPNQDISDESLSRLGYALMKLTSLKKLELYFLTCQKITGKGVTRINESLKELTDLQSLNLGFLGCEEIKEIGPADFRKLTSLRAIDLTLQTCKNLNEQGVLSLSKTLSGLSSLRSMKILLTGNQEYDFNVKRVVNMYPKINDEAFFTLMEALDNSHASLQDLNLNLEGNDSISDLQFTAFGGCLKGLSALQNLTLKFDSCGNIGDEGVSGFAEGLKTLVSLKNISLNFSRCNKLTDEGFSCLGQGLKSLTSLEQMTLFFGSPHERTSLTNQGFLSCSKSFEKLVLLNKLAIYIPGICVDDTGLFEFSQSVRRLTLLQEIDLELRRAKISDKSLVELGQSFVRLDGLKRMDLRFNDCSKMTLKGKGSLEGKLKKRFPQACLSIDLTK